jgi:hypothetical protein
MPTFVDQMLAQYSSHDKPEDVIEKFRQFYKEKERLGRARGTIRRLSFISSLQSNLSKYKTQVPAPVEFKQKLHITREELNQLIKERAHSVRQNSIDIVAIDGDKFVRDCRELLTHPDFALKVIAVACLTGRRMTEIISTANFDPPQEPHSTNLIYWSCVTGMLKQRGRNTCIDIPLFAKRNEIVACVHALREQSQHLTAKDSNKFASKRISRAMKKYCPEISKIHNFRKLYALMCFVYFNQRNCSLPRLTSDVLGHHDISNTVLTYLNFRLENTGSLNFK